MAEVQCPSCATLSGITVPPGGILYDDSHWVVFLRARPLLVPGQGFIVLKRHCEHLNQLTSAELAALGSMLHHTQCAYDRVLQPAKIHFGLYAEGVKHLHLHIIPRMPTMPAGNIPMTFLHVWATLLASVRLKRPFPDAIVADVARQLRQAFAVVANNYTTGTPQPAAETGS
jgi:diadenosine tetraphosphate (Ap4A) HIT family hydrolase